MFGGADTVGNTLMVGTFHLLKQPEKLQKLKEELLTAWPTLNGQEPELRHLDKLPYLNAVIKESLRLSSGVTAGLLRVVPATGATIAGVTVPPGVGPFPAQPPSHSHLICERRVTLPVAAPLYITMRTSFLIQRNSSQSDGFCQTSLTTGLLPSRTAHACVSASSELHPSFHARTHCLELIANEPYIVASRGQRCVSHSPMCIENSTSYLQNHCMSLVNFF